MNQKISSSRTERLGQTSAGLVLLLFIAGCSTIKSSAPPEPVAPPPAVEEAPTVEEAPAAVAPEDSTVGTELRLQAVGIAFLEPELLKRIPPPVEFIQAEGVGLPSKNAEDAREKQLTALQAARYRALANLAEMVYGQEVSREAQVVDMAFAGEEIQASLDGTLKGVTEVSRNYDESSGMATVVLKMALEPKADKMDPKQRRSLEERKARAETAARIHAVASLREQIGQVLVEQDVQVENLEMKHQQARVYVQGLMEGIRYSAVRWPSPEKCEVTASVELDTDKLAALAPDAFSEEVPPDEIE